jgi:hypothetical protein
MLWPGGDAQLAEALAFAAAESRGRRVSMASSRTHTTEAEPTVAPEQALREAGIGSRRQAVYQRKMSTLLAGPDAAPTAAMKVEREHMGGQNDGSAVPRPRTVTPKQPASLGEA